MELEESTEDAHRMGAVEPLEDPYLRSGFWALAWRRGLWLSILFLIGAVAGGGDPARRNRTFARWPIPL